ncbi:hypothetical protein OIV83_000657 [Microbotryomycetes sp. JL201]|nr:hypothetical protein OIV83_000657 [Microbotryomycetes sp. JL201]
MSFVDAALARVHEITEGKIDYVGQDKSEQYMKRILYYTAIVVPPHAMYNKHPVKWLGPLDDYGEPATSGKPSKLKSR